MFFFPVSIILFIILILFLPILLILIQLNIIQIAYGNLGFSPFQAFLFLILSLIGSTINIPIYKKQIENPVIDNDFLLPFMKKQLNSYTLAINVGGFLIPFLITLKLMPNLPFDKVLMGVFIVSLVSYLSSQPVKHTGIRVAFLLPLIATLFTAHIFVDPIIRAKYAFVIGTMGILIGADIMHLNKMEKIGAGVLSIGGAGVFDSIFFIGILSAFIL